MHSIKGTTKQAAHAFLSVVAARALLSSILGLAVYIPGMLDHRARCVRQAGK